LLKFMKENEGTIRRHNNNDLQMNAIHLPSNNPKDIVSRVPLFSVLPGDWDCFDARLSYVIGWTKLVCGRVEASR
jgi:hypothetical protein